MVLLIEKEPEEALNMKRPVKGEVISSTFDEPVQRQFAVAGMVIEKAKRLTELKKDFVILLDSITRLGRAFNAVIPSPGKVLTVGVMPMLFKDLKDFSVPPEILKKGGRLQLFLLLS